MSLSLSGYKNRRNNKELPRVPQKLKELSTFYAPITQDEKDSIPNKERIDVDIYIFRDGHPAFLAPMKGLYEGIKKYVRTSEDQEFDSSLFIIGYRPEGTTEWLIFYVPRTITIRRMLIESGLFNPNIYYYIDNYLLTESAIEKPIWQLCAEDGLPERAVISMRESKSLFTQSKITTVSYSHMIPNRFT